MRMRVHASQRLERLADKFALDRAAHPAPPLAADPVLVQSPGMRRFLTLRVADRIGVAANLRFLFPNEFIDRLFDALLPPRPASAVDPFAPAILAWRIMRRIDDLPGDERLRPLRDYARDGDLAKRFAFAATLADLYERYALHRPDRVLAWERGEPGESPDEAWQAELWRLLLAELPAPERGTHRAARLRDFLAAAEAAGDRFAPPWSRVAVFGVSSLPPFHFEALAAVARVRPVEFYLLNPCRDYWGDIRSARESLRRELRGAPAAAEPALDEGHPLLAGFGRPGREFFDLRVDFGCTENPEDEPWPDGEEPFAPAPGDTYLERLQNSLLDLARSGAEAAATLDPPAPGDDSLEFHACHGPRREVETLHDRLLDLLDRDPALAPHDILVAAPDIEPYVPFIEAVFGAPESPARRIPHTVADRRLTASSAYLRALRAMLDRLDAPEDAAATLALLAADPVRRRFGLAPEGIERLGFLTAAARIRAGLEPEPEGDDRASPCAANTWRAGFERLLLGVALGAHDGPVPAGIPPCDDASFADAPLLGACGDFLAAYAAARAEARSPADPESWRTRVAGWLDRFLDPGDEETAREEALAALHAFADGARDAGFAAAIPFPLVRERILEALGRAERGRGFLASGVTFCSLLPMRCVPARVVALLGIDDGAFPRTADPPGFDWSARARRAGDRSKRDDDRYLFLETLLSARETLHISFNGQNPQDNESRPPSPVVTELLDALETLTRRPDGAPSLRERLVVRHPLQPFSPSLFPGDPARAGFSTEMRDAAAALLAARRDPPAKRPLFPGPLPPPERDDDWTLADLTHFLRNPARALLAGRLGIRLPGEEGAPETREPFTLAGLERYELKALLAERLESGGAGRAALGERIRAAGLLPEGEPGRLLFEREAATVERFLAACRAEGEAPPDAAPLPFAFRLPGATLTGALRGGDADARVVRRLGKLDGRSVLAAWLEHLALCVARGGGRTTIVALREPTPAEKRRGESDGQLPDVHRFASLPAETARMLLAAFVDAARRGRREPVPAFAGAMHEFASAVDKGNDDDAALDQARRAFEDEGRFGGSAGEGHDPWIRLAFRDREALDGSFVELARTLALPAVEALHE